MATANLTTPPAASTSKVKSSAKRGPKKGTWLLLGIVGLGIVGFFSRGYLSASLSGSGAGPNLYQTQTVERGLLRVTITEDGNVESARNEDIKCTVEGGSQILWIIPEGTQVKKGTLLVKLDSSAIDDLRTGQKIVYEKARAALIKAEEDFAVKSIAVKEYTEGVFIKELQTAESNIVIAKENLKSSQNTLEHSERMFRKGYINQLQLEQNKFSVQRAQLDLDAFETAKKVLVEYTKSKMTRELESLRDAASAELAASKAACDLEKGKLERLEEQVKRCTIHAPQDGMVIYGNDRSGGFRGGSGAPTIEEGAQVREFQTIIRLPDLSQMQIKVLVHESKIENVRIGQPAIIRIRDRDLRGTVVSVSSQPEAMNFFAASVKEYASIVRIDNMTGEDHIKPGMTAEVEIIVAELPDVLSVPLTGVVEQDKGALCYVRTPTGYETRRVSVGMGNDQYLEIKDGLNAGDQVILNPRSTIAEARQLAHQKSLARVDGGHDVKVVKSKGEQSKGDGKGEQAKAGAPAESGAAPAVGGAAPATGGAAPAVGGGAPAGASPAVAKGGESKKAARKDFNIMSLDQNKDGKISRDEAPERMKPMFGMMDSNGDGFLDAKEVAEVRKKFQQKQAAKPSGPLDKAEGGQ
jgi:multidrug efflux pump subunit AcrA (membrane-fusion protein)